MHSIPTSAHESEVPQVTTSFILAAFFICVGAFLAVFDGIKLLPAFSHWPGIAVVVTVCAAEAIIFSFVLWRLTTGRTRLVRATLIASLIVGILAVLVGAAFALNVLGVLLNYGFDTYYRSGYVDPRWIARGRGAEQNLFLCIGCELAAVVVLPFCIRKSRHWKHEDDRCADSNQPGGPWGHELPQWLGGAPLPTDPKQQ
jgi:hypothetical protein